MSEEESHHISEEECDPEQSKYLAICRLNCSSGWIHQPVLVSEKQPPARTLWWELSYNQCIQAGDRCIVARLSNFVLCLNVSGNVTERYAHTCHLV